MEKRKYLWGWIAGILVMSFGALVLGIDAHAIREKTGVPEPRADLIVMNTCPEVIFLHDLHTDALEKQDKGCTTCHMPVTPGSDRLSPKFKSLADMDPEALETLCRRECLGCHQDMAKTGQDAGPVQWEDCYREKVAAVSTLKPYGLDKSLHFRHTQATTAPCQKYQWNKEKNAHKGDCGTCHHEYNAETKTLFYAKGKEGSCRYCHLKETEENRVSMRLASHWGCIECHQQKQAEKETTGPYRCGDCHDLKKQQMVKRVKAVPRIKRNQPDLALLDAAPPNPDPEAPVTGMSPVLFGHKAHEAITDTCMGCHHAGLDPCSQKCHTPEGAKEGQYINYKQAMHQSGCQESCIGCHEDTLKTPACAACHAFMPKAGLSESACLVCHSVEEKDAKTVLNENLMAGMLLERKKAQAATYKDEDIPEKVLIKVLSDQYEPAELPHRKIVKTLFKNIQDNRLATAFHPEIGTVCQGCHHQSPPDRKPPRCGSCHGRQSFDGQNQIRPGIRGAYHQQCTGCHEKLNLEKPRSVACTDCHKEKKQVGKAN